MMCVCVAQTLMAAGYELAAGYGIDRKKGPAGDRSFPPSLSLFSLPLSPPLSLSQFSISLPVSSPHLPFQLISFCFACSEEITANDDCLGVTIFRARNLKGFVKRRDPVCNGRMCVYARVRACVSVLMTRSLGTCPFSPRRWLLCSTKATKEGPFPDL